MDTMSLWCEVLSLLNSRFYSGVVRIELSAVLMQFLYSQAAVQEYWTNESSNDLRALRKYNSLS